MNKIIHIYYINKIKMCMLNIFDAEDDDYPNIKKVKANERAIERWLNKADIFDKNLRQELLENINWTNDNCVKTLEKLGWKVCRDKLAISKKFAKEQLKELDYYLGQFR